MSVTLYGVNGDHIRSLTQWDYDITIEISGAKISPVPEARYSNRNSTHSIPVNTTIVDGRVVSVIPNELLQENSPIEIQLFYSYDSGDSKTEYRAVIPVAPAKKPAGYAYTPTEVTSLAELTRRVEKLEQSGGSSGSSGLTITDDGAGNVVIASGGSSDIVDDGVGNITFM